MNMKKGFLLLAGILSLTYSLPVLAETNLGNLSEMSLEDILNMEVSSASKSNLTIQRAPGIIRVFTKDDIQKFGFTTLKDLLSNIPGIQIQEYRSGHQLVWVRGVQSRYNDKVLLQIDGVPMRDSYYGNFNIDEMVPLENIEKVEIINGPGSVLYGTNAFAGVISITTKKEGKSLRAEYGTYNSLNAAMEGSYGNLYGYVDYFNTSGFSPKLNIDGKAWEHLQNAKRFYGLFKFKNDNFDIIGSLTDYKYPYKYREEKKDDYFTRRPIYGSARYSRDLKDSGSFNIQAYMNSYNYSREKAKLSKPGAENVTSKEMEYLDSVLLGVDADYSLNFYNNSMIAGLSFQQDRGDNITLQGVFPKLKDIQPNLAGGKIARNDFGLFLQDIWNINDNISLTGGVRYDFLSNFNNEFNYRVGVTGQTPFNLYGKVLYGTAYRVPSYREYLNISSPNDALKPEHLNTLEAQVGYVFEHGDLNLTFFNNVYKDFIGDILVASIVNPDGTKKEIKDEMDFNFKEKNISGLELNSIFYPFKELSIGLGASALLNAKQELGNAFDPKVIIPNDKIETGVTDITFISKYTANLLLSYRFMERFNLGFNVTYASDRLVPENYQKDVPAENKNPANANYYIKTDVFGSAKILDNLTLNLGVANVFDTKIYSMPISTPNSYDMEWPGRYYKVNLKYSL